MYVQASKSGNLDKIDGRIKRSIYITANLIEFVYSNALDMGACKSFTDSPKNLEVPPVALKSVGSQTN